MGNIQESVYQFCRQNNYPIYITSSKLPEDHPFWATVSQMAFQKLDANEIIQWKKEWGKVIHGKQLVVELLTSHQGLPSAGGLETVWSQKGHYSYYHKATALMSYAFPVKEWKLGLLPPNGGESSYQLTLIRFLSWALSGMGGIGVWGHLFQKGAMVTAFKGEKSEAVFLDTKNKRLISTEGTIQEEEMLCVYRSDACISHAKRFTPEEVYGLLLARTTFLHPFGVPLEARESMMRIGQHGFGVRVPQKVLMPDLIKALSD